MKLEDFIRENGQAASYSPQSHIFMQGDEDRSLYYVRDGLLKAYYVTESGKEAIKSFLFSGDIIGSMTAVYGEKTCSFNLLCLRDTSVVRIPFEKMYLYAQEDLSLSNEIIELLISFSMKKERREYELLCLTAEERYRLMLQRSPDIFQYVTQNDIARYLGITPVGLSRIKKRIK